MDPKDLREEEVSGEMLRVAEAARVLGLTEPELRRIYALGGVRGAFAPTGTLLLQKKDVERLQEEIVAFRGASPRKAEG